MSYRKSSIMHSKWQFHSVSIYEFKKIWNYFSVLSSYYIIHTFIHFKHFEFRLYAMWFGNILKFAFLFSFVVSLEPFSFLFSIRFLFSILFIWFLFGNCIYFMPLLFDIRYSECEAYSSIHNSENGFWSLAYKSI